MNVGTLIFFFVGSCGIVTTVIVLYRLKKRARISDHIHALVVSVGLGFTWMVSPLAAFIAPGGHLDIGFVVFWIVHTLILAIFLYVGDRIYLRSRFNKKK